jgi:hypothetical protein
MSEHTPTTGEPGAPRGPLLEEEDVKQPLILLPPRMNLFTHPAVRQEREARKLIMGMHTLRNLSSSASECSESTSVSLRAPTPAQPRCSTAADADVDTALPSTQFGMLYIVTLLLVVCSTRLRSRDSQCCMSGVNEPTCLSTEAVACAVLPVAVNRCYSARLSAHIP